MDFVYKKSQPGISIVFPAYNEEANITAAVTQSHAILSELTTQPFEIVVVNDGSKDQTGSLLADLCAQYPELCAVNHPKNLGYGQAVLTGIRHTRYDQIFFTDADLQFDLRELRHFLSEINNYDLVIGYRIDRKDPWHRLVFAYLWNKTQRLLFGLKVRDVDCAFKLFHRKVMSNLQIYSLGAMMSSEFLIKAISNGNRLLEIGVQHYPRLSGKPTGGNYKVIARAFKELGKFFWRWYVVTYRPPVSWPSCHLNSARLQSLENVHREI